ncbi:craniofacial development protein 2-like [Chironomus tepperi]|uniref:craniofacial development protein 2-like n=1 Tax=Chironomus tepperi TaxID=113505 RepID=UPI00391F009E
MPIRSSGAVQTEQVSLSVRPGEPTLVKKCQATKRYKNIQRTDLPTTTPAKHKRTGDLQLSTWNVRTLTQPGALQALVLELRHYKSNITAIQETRWIGNNVLDVSRFRVFASGNATQRIRGTGFIVDPLWSEKVIDWKPVSDRLCVLRIKGKFFNISIINVYAPTNERPDDEKDAFYSQLERTYDNCPRSDIKIVIGDVNAQIGREKTFKPTIGSFSLHPKSNENGLRLITFAAAMNMRISSTYFQRRSSRKATWSPPGGGKSARSIIY